MIAKRALSQNPATVERRERRIMADINRQEREWMREVMAHMETHGVDFDTAFVACGGAIYDDEDLRKLAEDARNKA
jgi:hypothetical protein